MALHTRYPGHNNHKPIPGSPLGRMIDIIDAVFARCKETACLPVQALPLVSYWDADNDPAPLKPAPANPTAARAATLPEQRHAAETSRNAGVNLADVFGSDDISRGEEDDRGGAFTRGGDVKGDTGPTESAGVAMDALLEEGKHALYGGLHAALSSALLDEPAVSGPSQQDQYVASQEPQQRAQHHHRNKWTSGHRNALL